MNVRTHHNARKETWTLCAVHLRSNRKKKIIFFPALVFFSSSLCAGELQSCIKYNTVCIAHVITHKKTIYIFIFVNLTSALLIFPPLLIGRCAMFYFPFYNRIKNEIFTLLRVNISDSWYALFIALERCANNLIYVCIQTNLSNGF